MGAATTQPATRAVHVHPFSKRSAGAAVDSGALQGRVLNPDFAESTLRDDKAPFAEEEEAYPTSDGRAIAQIHTHETMTIHAEGSNPIAGCRAFRCEWMSVRGGMEPVAKESLTRWTGRWPRAVEF